MNMRPTAAFSSAKHPTQPEHFEHSMGSPQFCSSIMLCLISALVLTFASQSRAADYRYVAQVKSLGSLVEANCEIQRLKTLSIPANISKTSKNEKPFYRIRIGYFRDSISAVNMAAFLGYEKPWILRESTSLAHVECVSLLRNDSIAAQPVKSSYYIPKSHAFFAIYLRQFGFEASVKPSALIVYSKDFKHKFVIDELTGFMETDSSIVFGNPVFLERSSSGIFKSGKELQSKLRKHNIGFPNAENKLSHFGDQTEIRINLKSELMLHDFSVRKLNAQGFDYVDNEKRQILWSDPLEGKVLGNALLKPWPDKGVSVLELGRYRVLHALTENTEMSRIIVIDLQPAVNDDRIED